MRKRRKRRAWSEGILLFDSVVSCYRCSFRGDDTYSWSPCPPPAPRSAALQFQLSQCERQNREKNTIVRQVSLLMPVLSKLRPSKTMMVVLKCVGMPIFFQLRTFRETTPGNLERPRDKKCVAAQKIVSQRLPRKGPGNFRGARRARVSWLQARDFQRGEP